MDHLKTYIDKKIEDKNLAKQNRGWRLRKHEWLQKREEALKLAEEEKKVKEPQEDALGPMDPMYVPKMM